MADPGFPINCPVCGAPLVYIRTEGDNHVFRCHRHGVLILPPDGRLRQLPQ